MASRELHIPLSKIYISETSTNTVPNTFPSSGSYTTDGNGVAVKVKSLPLSFSWLLFKKRADVCVLNRSYFRRNLTHTIYRLHFLSFRMPARFCTSDWSQSDRRTQKGHGRAGYVLIRKENRKISKLLFGIMIKVWAF